MITVFGGAAKLHCRAGAGDRPAAMMLAQVEETNRVGDCFPGQIDGLGRCRLRTQNKSLLSVKIRCVARKSMGDRVMPTGFTWRAMRLMLKVPGSFPR
jgi:hypothetical protein